MNALNLAPGLTVGGGRSRGREEIRPKKSRTQHQRLAAPMRRAH
jgi:hypothetical protein